MHPITSIHPSIHPFTNLPIHPSNNNTTCSGLPPRSLLSHPGHQRSQFTPLIGTEVTLCSLCSYIHVQPRPVRSRWLAPLYIRGRWLAPLCGMGFLCRKDFSPGFFLTHFTLA